MTAYLEKLFDLTGRVALVTGAGGHLCGCMAKALSDAGAAVGVADLREEKVSVVCSDITQNNGNAIPIVMDATRKEDFEGALDILLNKYGHVDILVNGAGINSPTPFFEIDIESWRSVIESHLTSTLFGCQVIGRHMTAKQRGSIINISSASAGPPLSKAFGYSVAKAGVKNLTQNLAREWAPFSVRVNAVRPGFFPTQWNRKNFITPDREKAILGHTPMGRYGEPEELNGAVIWLSSDASSFVTGAEITVDGGFSAMTI